MVLFSLYVVSPKRHFIPLDNDDTFCSDLLLNLFERHFVYFLHNGEMTYLLYFHVHNLKKVNSTFIHITLF